MCDYSFVYSLFKSRQNSKSTINKLKNKNSSVSSSLTQTLTPSEFRDFRKFQR